MIVSITMMISKAVSAIIRIPDHLLDFGFGYWILVYFFTFTVVTFLSISQRSELAQ